MKFKRQADEEVSVNLTPLIDVVFLLLIFFMVSTTFTKESHLEIELPEAVGEKSAADDSKQIELIISDKGDFSINDRPLVNNKEDTIKKAIEKVSGGDKKLPFVITADAQTPHEFVVRAMDVAGKLGFVHLSITTQRAGASN